MIATLKAQALPCSNGITFGTNLPADVTVPANVSNALQAKANADPQYQKAMAKEVKQSKIHANGFAPFTWRSFTSWACDYQTCYVSPGQANWAEQLTSVFAFDGFFVVGGGGWPGTYTAHYHANLPLWNVSDENDYFVWNVGVAFTGTPYVLARDYFNVSVGAFWFSYTWSLHLWHNDYIDGSTANGLVGSAW